MMDLVDRLLTKIREKHRRIVIVGDVILDRWVHGHTAECQDGCPKFVQELSVDSPGGAANAENCLVGWGNNVSLYGWSQTECPVKCRYVQNGKMVFRADDDRTPHEGHYHWSYSLALEMIERAGAVLISDYDKGYLSPEFIRKVADLCAERRILCVADCKREPILYDGCILKCNADYQHEHYQDLGRLVFDQEKGQRLVVTGGPMNPIVWDGAGPTGLGYDPPPVTCVNHVGAGDCFAAHLTLALAYGFSLREAAALAHSAGRVYVQRPHNQPPPPDRIAADMRIACVATST
jgi:bifunctional ADP-heptose synthase (sugar kinase/adenylyltransferase)